MINIDEYKVNSIFEVIPKSWFLKQTFKEEYLESGNCYEVYYALGNYYKPKTILEIGVLFGYSAGALILGAKDSIERFDGYDIDWYSRNTYALKGDDNSLDSPNSIPIDTEIEYENWSSNKIAYYKLHELIVSNFGEENNIELNIMLKDTQHLNYLNNYYDMIHIDGAHPAKEKQHDLYLTVGRCDVVVIDDYDFVPTTKQVVDEFVKRNKNVIQNTIYIPSFRGTYVIEYSK